MKQSFTVFLHAALLLGAGVVLQTGEAAAITFSSGTSPLLRVLLLAAFSVMALPFLVVAWARNRDRLAPWKTWWTKMGISACLAFLSVIPLALVGAALTALHPLNHSAFAQTTLAFLLAFLFWFVVLAIIGATSSVLAAIVHAPRIKNYWAIQPAGTLTEPKPSPTVSSEKRQVYPCYRPYD